MKIYIVILLSFLLGLVPIKSATMPDVPKINLTEKDLKCLVKNAYYEARGEGKLGMQLVTKVVINRAKKSLKSVCQIIFERNQFSWTTQYKGKIPKESFNYILNIILEMYFKRDSLPLYMEDVTYFHHKSIKPKWSSSLKKVGYWNNHVFYKES